MSDGRPPPSMGTPVALRARRTPIMDITTLAAWGEFLGGIGVVASLIYYQGSSGVSRFYTIRQGESHRE